MVWCVTMLLDLLVTYKNKESKGIYRNLLLTKRPTLWRYRWFKRILDFQNIPSFRNLPKIHMHHRWPPSDPTKPRLIFVRDWCDCKYPVPPCSTWATKIRPLRYNCKKCKVAGSKTLQYCQSPFCEPGMGLLLSAFMALSRCFHLTVSSSWPPTCHTTVCLNHS